MNLLRTPRNRYTLRNTTPDARSATGLVADVHAVRATRADRGLATNGGQPRNHAVVVDRRVSKAFLSLTSSLLWCGAMASPTVAQVVVTPVSPAWTTEADYSSTFFVTPNGNPNYAAPMVRLMIGAGGAGLGGGQYVKVGINLDVSFARFTEGASQPHPSGGPDIIYDFKYYANRGPQWVSAPLPPDVTSMSQLPTKVQFGLDDNPATVEDNLPTWANPAKAPFFIAYLEWARYYDLPVAIQLIGGGPQSGEEIAGEINRDLDRMIEKAPFGNAHCQWDASDYVDPDNNSSTLEPVGGGALGYSIATTCVADRAVGLTMTPPIDLVYHAYFDRNLHDALSQAMAYCELRRYAGRLVSVAYLPEFHLQAIDTTLPDVVGTGVGPRAFYGDYNPVMKRQFQLREAARYGDTHPTVDSNGDGVTFWGDFAASYLASGSTAHPHPALTWTSTWFDVDPPRINLLRTGAADPRLWHEWCNFRTEVLDAFIERSMHTIHQAGVPANRVFLHQTYSTGSFAADRLFAGKWDWCDDYLHVEKSFAWPGISIYQPSVLEGVHPFKNMEIRGRTWGAPEFNPYVTGGPLPATQQQTHDAVFGARAHGAQVIWPHAWGAVSHPVIDVTSLQWLFDAATANLAGWMQSANVVAIPLPPAAPLALQATGTGPWYIESTPTTAHFPINATRRPFVVVEMQATYVTTPAATIGPLTVEFQTATTGSQWWSVAGNLRPWTPATRTFVVDMTQESHWTGNITAMRIGFWQNALDHVYVESITMPGSNPMSSELKNLATTYATVPRVVPTSVFAPTLPINLATAITNAQAAGNLAVFGTDPYPHPVSGAETFDDFGTAGNFEWSLAASGGVVRESISQPASTRVGMRKTGRFERLQLPNVTDLYLTFRMGLNDGVVPTTFDGVMYRVLLRDAAREIHVLYAKEWRSFSWTRPVFLDLSPYAGQIVDLSFEVHAQTDGGADRALWGEPSIGRFYYVEVATGGLGSGTVTPDPTGYYAPATVVNLTATPAGGSVFAVWTTSGTPGDIANLSAAATTLTMNGNHSVSAKFGFTATFTSTAANDGWILESGPTSSAGGTLDWTSNSTSSLRTGDNNQRKQYLSVVSFETSTLPDTATVSDAVLRLRRGTAVGTTNTAAFGALVADVVPGVFGTLPSLEALDFASNPPGLATAAATLAYPASNGALAAGPLGPAGRAAISLVSLTQMRVRFVGGDNGNGANDYLGFYSGATTTMTGGVTNKPQLIVTYY